MRMSSSVTRRSFLGATANAAAVLLANKLFGAPADATTKPSPDLEKLGAVAIDEAKKQGATYADIRINRYRQQFSGWRLAPQRNSNKTDEVPFVTDQQSFGFGVRVIANGQWGFAASPLVTPEEIARITREAVLVAKFVAVLEGEHRIKPMLVPGSMIPARHRLVVSILPVIAGGEEVLLQTRLVRQRI